MTQPHPGSSLSPLLKKMRGSNCSFLLPGVSPVPPFAFLLSAVDKSFDSPSALRLPSPPLTHAFAIVGNSLFSFFSTEPVLGSIGADRRRWWTCLDTCCAPPPTRHRRPRVLSGSVPAQLAPPRSHPFSGRHTPESHHTLHVCLLSDDFSSNSLSP